MSLSSYSYERDNIFVHTLIIVYVFVFSYDENLKSCYILKCLNFVGVG